MKNNKINSNEEREIKNKKTLKSVYSNINDFEDFKPKKKETLKDSIINSKQNNNTLKKEELKYILEEINLIPDKEDELIHSYPLLSNNYISKCFIKNYSEDNFILLYQEYQNNISDLKKEIDTLSLSNTECDNIEIFDCIGYISSLEKVFKEKNPINDLLIEKLKTLKNICYRWRKIKGDGNCFYRAIIFAYIEGIILSNNLSRLKDLICDMNTKFKNKKLNEILIQNKIERNKIILYMMTIFCAITPSELSEIDPIIRAYEIFIKCFNNYKDFDYGLIFYFKFILFNFIQNNEDKSYSKEFPVMLGNLLPSEYETEDGIFLFEKFYNENLLKLYKDSEKIVIYVTPYVLDINFNILMFEPSYKTLSSLKFINVEESEDHNIITILYKGAHYDISYNEKFVNLYYNYLYLFDNENNNQDENISLNVILAQDNNFIEVEESQNIKHFIQSKGIGLNKKKIFNSVNQENDLINEEEILFENEDENSYKYNTYREKIKNNFDEKIKNSLNLHEQHALSDDEETIFNESLRSSIIFDENNTVIDRNEEKIKKKFTFTKLIKKKNSNNHHHFEYLKKIRNKTPNKLRMNFSQSNKNINPLDLKQIIQKYSNNNNFKEENLFNSSNFSIDKNYLSLNLKNNQTYNKKKEEINQTIECKKENINKKEIQKTEEVNKKKENSKGDLKVEEKKEYVQKKEDNNKLEKEKYLDTNKKNGISNETVKSINQTQNKITTTGKKCKLCNKSFKKYENINEYYLCNECLKNEFLNVIIQAYKDFLKENKNKKLIRNFSSIFEFKSIKINNINTRPYNVIYAYNKNSDDDKININNILSDVINNICAYCLDSNFIKSKKLPCNCCFCNENCLKKFLLKIYSFNFDGDINNKKGNFQYNCICGNIYSIKQIESLIKICNDISIENENLLNELNKLFNVKKSSLCISCGNEITNLFNEYYNLKFVPDSTFQNSFSTHLMCINCFKKINPSSNQRIQCSICNNSHILKQVSKILNNK